MVTEYIIVPTPPKKCNSGGDNTQGSAVVGKVARARERGSQAPVTLNGIRTDFVRRKETSSGNKFVSPKSNTVWTLYRKKYLNQLIDSITIIY